MRTLPLALAVLAACTAGPDAGDPTASLPVGQAGTAPCVDADFDGYCGTVDDCNDNDATIYPGATDVVGDAIDQDCDGGDSCFADADGDHWGDATRILPSPNLSCADAGEASNGGDCDDTDASAHPGATEIVADGIDQDCDYEELCHADVDGDGYGDPTALRRSFDLDCADFNESTNTTDCDDTRGTIHPGAPEQIANGYDDDCDGAELCHLDDDRDGYGSVTGTVASPDLECTGVGESPTGTDCDDSSATAHPGATEVCDAGNVDEDCDGAADDDDADAIGKSSFFVDADNDGYGTGTAVVACDAPLVGMASTAGDCNDRSASQNPGVPEVCDFLNTDEDCDGAADDADASATGLTSWFLDADGDRYGVGTGVPACDAPMGYAAPAAGDCNDAVATINPGQAEVCDASRTDEDCDGHADDADADVVGKIDWYEDVDADGYGAGSPEVACHSSLGRTTTRDGDCDDLLAAANPDATEVCDAGDVDEDCDGNADDADASATGKSSWYADVDGDGFGAGGAFQACDAQPSYPVANHDDCDDRRANVRPGGTEICDANNRDEDCDGSADDADPSATGQGTWYADSDLDGAGVGAPHISCDASVAFPAPVDGDCDDADDARAPAFTDVQCDGIDQDCSGSDAVDALNCVPPTDTDDTDAGDTEVTDTEVDTDVIDTEVTDTEVADTDVVETDTNDTTGDSDTDDGKDDGGCKGCSTGAPAPGLALLLVAAALSRRRRR